MATITIGTETWLVSWFWSWRKLPAPPPNAPLPMPADVADRLGGLVTEHAAVNGLGFLALIHERVARDTGSAVPVRCEYRVAPRVRFLTHETSTGAARTALEHVRRLEANGALGSTRGPFYLIEVLSQGGLSVLTLRSDVLHGESVARLGTYLTVAASRPAVAGEPTRFGVLELGSDRVVWTTDDLLSRAWHAPLAGGESLSLLPDAAPAGRTRSGAFARDSWRPEAGSAGERKAR